MAEAQMDSSHLLAGEIECNQCDIVTYLKRNINRQMKVLPSVKFLGGGSP